MNLKQFVLEVYASLSQELQPDYFRFNSGAT